ncbi:MAG: glucose-1-phosphate thymidylyltransferase RfbA [Eubacterium sp.]|nr:glucose-1-phosphate thymidylyltransferase RfbA [Eubacterium sp.]
MKGIILAGGKGTRLYPNTLVVSKQLLPVYDKPLIYYPLSTLLLADIKDILIISTPYDTPNFQRLLGDGSKLGVSIQYAVQDTPRGLADAFILGKDFIGNDDVCLILGDNIFYGRHFGQTLREARLKVEDGSANIFAYCVKHPNEFGVVEFDDNFKAVSIEEKPKKPKSNYAVPGLYFYNNSVVDVAANVKPSARGEIEITSINNYYLEKEMLKVSVLGRGMAWLDTGSPKGMFKAGNYVKNIQEMQGFYIACIEEIAWRRGFIDDNQLEKLGNEMISTEYGKYIISLLEDKNI